MKVRLGYIAITLYSVFLVLSISFVKLGSPIPFRVVFLFFSIAFVLFFSSSGTLGRFLHANQILHLTIFLSIFSVISSFFGVGANLIFTNYFSWIIQPILTMFFCYLVALNVGQKVFAFVTFFIFGINFLFAIFQGFELNSAWEFKYYLDSFQDLGKEIKALDEISFEGGGVYDDSSRAKGLSWSAIHLSYQACLIIGLCFVLDRDIKFFSFGKIFLFFIFVLSFGAIVFSGTRSALLGVAVLIYIYGYIISSNKIIYSIFIVVAVFSLTLLVPIFQEVLDIRILQANDSSAAMRIPLYLFGLILILNRPWGYGWGDESYNYASDYWYIFSGFEGAESLFRVGLHNYLFNVLWLYGVFGFFVLHLIFKSFYLRYGKVVFISFSAYFLNSLFHNGGFLMGGNFIWIFLGFYHYVQTEYEKTRCKI